MLFSRLMAAVAASVALLAGALANAAPVDLNQWYVFGFDGPGTVLYEGSCCSGTLSIPAPNTPWTFTLTGGAELVVVDGFATGDQFELFNFGTSLGLTSVPVIGGDCGADELACLADSDASSGFFILGAGSYAITGIAVQSPFGAGAGFFIIRSTPSIVAEPGSLALLGLGVAMLGFIGRRPARHTTA